MSILFFGKRREDFYCQRAIDFTIANFPETTIVLGQAGEPFPKEWLEWRGDYILSYLCPWVLPDALLRRAQLAAINFHPASPDYPGIGCTNFAIYNQEQEYGVTCHYMAPKVDSGQIIAVRRFAVLPADNVYSLTQRCYAYMLVLYYEIMTGILRGEPLPKSSETWSRKPYTRAELNELKRITLDMPEEEIKRRIKAVTFPGTGGAYLEIGGERFEHRPDEG